MFARAASLATGRDWLRCSRMKVMVCSIFRSLSPSRMACGAGGAVGSPVGSELMIISFYRNDRSLRSQTVSFIAPLNLLESILPGALDEFVFATNYIPQSALVQIFFQNLLVYCNLRVRER